MEVYEELPVAPPPYEPQGGYKLCLDVVLLAVLFVVGLIVAVSTAVVNK